MTNTKVSLLQTDSPKMPKLATRTFTVPFDKLALVGLEIERSKEFGLLGKGFLGQHSIELSFMGYGGLPLIPAIDNYRTARDGRGESLSRGYFFEKDDTPLNVFLLVKNPWRFWTRDHIYSVKGYVRSPEECLLSPAIKHLGDILRDLREN